MNIADDLINFDTTIKSRLGADYFKSIFKSMSYKSITIEWE
jgi:hypothetical protein